VNISRLQLDDATLPDQILAALSETGVAAERLLLEITESTLMHEPERISKMVSDVCDKGVGLHLDDFGTGYSSLSALLQFPVQALKIDRGFINPAADEDGSNRAIVRSTIALAHSLNLEVVAEGIETPAQLANLRALGCECGQGYLFARPLSAGDAEELFETWDQTVSGLLGTASPAKP
jgi:EAL domain-containing protein (putative c-di-GMP-specific phosphodiesterase class I)